MATTWYIGVSAAEHARRSAERLEEGQRLVSLGAYGTPTAPTYSAVWADVDGPPWVAFDGLSLAAYGAALLFNAARGWRPALLTVVGETGAGARYAGTFEATSGPMPTTQPNLIRPATAAAGDTRTIQFWLGEAARLNLIPTALAPFGRPGQPRFALILDSNPARIGWTADGLIESVADFEHRLEEYKSARLRIGLLAPGPGGLVTSIFRDDALEPLPVRDRSSLTTLRIEATLLGTGGYHPRSIQTWSDGALPQGTAIFGRSHGAPRRRWLVAGGADPDVDAIDNEVKAMMVASGARQAGLAIIQGPRLLYARGYNWSEPDYPIAEPTTFFRQASVSKVFTGLAVHQLIAEGLLDLDDRMQNILDLRQPDGTPPKDARFGDVTIRHLLEHRSGLNLDYMGVDQKVIDAFKLARPGLAHHFPATLARTESYMTTLDLVADPGTGQAYNNFGYYLLGRIVMRRRGKRSYLEAIQSAMLNPLDIRRVRICKTLASAQPSDEAWYYHRDDKSLRTSVMHDDRHLVPFGYGDEYLERLDGAGGLSAAVVDVARLLSSFSVWNNNPVLDPAALTNMLTLALDHGGHGFDSVSALPGGGFHAEKNGLLGTSRNEVWLNTGGLGYVMCWGMQSNEGQWYPFNTVLPAAGAHNWGTADLFPQYGMAAF